MAQKDITRRAVERASKRALGVVKRFQALVPYGPDQVQLSPSELQASLKEAKGARLMQYLDILGPDKIMQIMREQNG